MTAVEKLIYGKISELEKDYLDNIELLTSHIAYCRKYGFETEFSVLALLRDSTEIIHNNLETLKKLERLHVRLERLSLQATSVPSNEFILHELFDMLSEDLLQFSFESNLFRDFKVTNTLLSKSKQSGNYKLYAEIMAHIHLN